MLKTSSLSIHDLISHGKLLFVKHGLIAYAYKVRHQNPQLEL